MTTCIFFFFQAEDGIRDLVRSRGLGDVYKRQVELRGVRAPATRVRTSNAAVTTTFDEPVDEVDVDLSLIQI